MVLVPLLSSLCQFCRYFDLLARLLGHISVEKRVAKSVIGDALLPRTYRRVCVIVSWCAPFCIVTAIIWLLDFFTNFVHVVVVLSLNVLYLLALIIKRRGKMPLIEEAGVCRSRFRSTWLEV